LSQQDIAGGPCRSEMVDGAPCGYGGGTSWMVRRREVLDFIFPDSCPARVEQFERVVQDPSSWHGMDYPLEANLWQFPSDVQADFLESMRRPVPFRGEAMPNRLQRGLSGSLETACREYMLAVNRKIWSMDPDGWGRIGCPTSSVSFREFC